MTSLLATLWAHLASVSLQAACLAGLVYGLERMLGRWLRPAAAAALWWLVLLRFLLPADLASPVSVGALGLDLRLAVAAQPAAGWPAAAIGLWLGVAAFAGLAGAARAGQRLRRLRAGSGAVPAVWQASAAVAAAELGMSRCCEVRSVVGAGSPFTAGVRRPWIGIPVASLDLPPAMRHHVLLHELAHVRRHDAAFAAVALALQLLFWFHPAAWLAVRRLRTLRELRADALAVAGLDDQGGYRTTLLRVAQACSNAPTPRLAMSSGAAELLVRVAALRTPMPPRRWLAGLNVLLVGVVLFCCAPMAALPRPFFADVDRTKLPGCLLQRYAWLEAMAAEPR